MMKIALPLLATLCTASGHEFVRQLTGNNDGNDDVCECTGFSFYDSNASAPQPALRINRVTGGYCSASGRYGIVADFTDGECDDPDRVTLRLLKPGERDGDVNTESTGPFSLYENNGDDIFGNHLDDGKYILSAVPDENPGNGCCEKVCLDCSCETTHYRYLEEFQSWWDALANTPTDAKCVLAPIIDQSDLDAALDFLTTTEVLSLCSTDSLKFWTDLTTFSPSGATVGERRENWFNTNLGLPLEDESVWNLDEPSGPPETNAAIYIDCGNTANSGLSGFEPTYDRGRPLYLCCGPEPV